jgi:ankyrin repeat protein
MSTIFDFAREGSLVELQNYKGDVNVVDDDGHTPVERAIENNHLACVKYLVSDRGANVKDDAHNALYFAVQQRNIECVRFLMEKGAEYRESILYLAIYIGHVECVKYFTEHHGADLNKTDVCGQGLIHTVALQGNLDCLQYLVENGADVNKFDNDGEGPIHLAVRCGHFDCLKFLVEKGADVNAVEKCHNRNKDRTVLTLAVFNGHLDCVKYLIEQGASIHGSPKVESALEATKWRADNEHMAKWLLSNGADPFNDITLSEDDNSSIIFLARKTFKQRQAISAMMSVKIHPRLGQNSILKMLPVDIIHRLHNYVVV